MYLNQTSRLYEPLKTTLDKSMVQDPNLIYDQYGATSRISRRMRSLSPQQATYIKSSTNIPIDKELVPTGNLWRVQGKQFSAVDVQVRQGPPVPASAIRIQPAMKGAHITTQTVYQFQPRQSQIRSFSNTRSITNLRTIYPPPPPPVQQVSRVSQIPITNRYTQPTVEVRRTASPVRVSTMPSIPMYNSRTIQPINPINRNNIVDHNYMQQVEETRNSNMVNNMPPPANQYYGSGLQQNDIESKKKHKYKYNFFSALDEAINTKCGSCGANQIIASKPLSSWE